MCVPTKDQRSQRCMGHKDIKQESACTHQRRLVTWYITTIYYVAKTTRKGPHHPRPPSRGDAGWEGSLEQGEQGEAPLNRYDLRAHVARWEGRTTTATPRHAMPRHAIRRRPDQRPASTVLSKAACWSSTHQRGQPEKSACYH